MNEFERIEFESNQSLFKGKLYAPPDLNNCKGIVIFTHGLGYCDRQYKIDGRYFINNNYILMTYNLRAHAGTPGIWTLENSANDLIEAINFLTSKYKFKNNNKICVMGHSTGALIALLASLKDKRIKFGSIVTTVTCLTDSYLHWFKSGFNQEVKEFFKSKGVIPPIIERFMDDETMIDKYRKGDIPQAELEIPHRYGLLRSDSWNQFFHEIANSIDILNNVDEITMPLLLFRGEYDEVMNVQKTNELYEKVNNKIPCKLFFTKSKNHFHNDSWDLIQAITIKFFDEFCDYNRSGANCDTKDILLVDDEELVIKTLKIALVKHGFKNVITANSGMEAFQAISNLKNLKNKEFDLIISDIRMPGLDGIETIKRIQELIAERNGRQSLVMFITGYEGEKARVEAKGLGYVDYFYKPLDIHRFVQSVKKHLLGSGTYDQKDSCLTR